MACMANSKSFGCMLQDRAAALEHFGREQQRAAAAAATAAALGKGKAPAVPKAHKSAPGPDDAARCVVAATECMSGTECQMR